MQRLLVITIPVFFFLCKGYGQEAGMAPPELKFQHLDKELNNNQVSAILQDKYGFIWIGTFGGLHKYDGVKLEPFLSSKDKTSILDDRIESIFEDNKGRLWIGTYEGICQYDRKNNSFIRYETKNNSNISYDPNTNRIRDIIQDRNGLLWIASQKEGLFIFDESSSSFVPYFKSDKENLPGTYNITALQEGIGDDFWIGTLNDGLFRLNMKNNKIVNYKRDKNDSRTISGNNVTDIKIDLNNDIWVATANAGIERLEIDSEAVSFIHYRHDSKRPNTTPGNNDVRQLYIDSQNNVWACHENGGLNLYDRKHDLFWPYFPDANDPNSISNASTWCIFEDKEGRYWVGSSLEGIDIMDKYLFKFSYYSNSRGKSETLNNNIVRDFFEDEVGNLWIATDGGGLNYFDRKDMKFSYYMHDPFNPKSISSNATLSICEDNDGYLWVSTWQGGINIFDRKTGTFTRFPFLSKDVSNVFSLIKDQKGNIWIGTYDAGLNKFDWDSKKLTAFLNDPSNPASISHNIVPVVFEDSEGNIWAGTEDNGVNFLARDMQQEGVFKRYAYDPAKPESLAANLVNDIFEDSRRNIWIATSGGLCRFVKDSGTFVNYTVENGLPANHVKSVIEDQRGFLWIGTSKGLSKFDPANKKFNNYDKKDGLQPGEFTRYCTYKTSNKELVFGGTGGFNIFYPDDIIYNPHIPPVYITDLRIFNKQVQVGAPGSPLDAHVSLLDKLILSHSHSVFTLDFVALNFTNPDKNEYAFRLEGLEKDWNYVGNQQSATYTNLNPGEYIFQVKASNNDGVWNEEGKSLKIVITPPFWQTWLFRLITLIVLAGLIYLVFYTRTRRLRKINAQLEEMVSERTNRLNELVKKLQEKQDEIETTNEELTCTLEDLYIQKNRVEDVNEKLEKTHEELRIVNQELDSRVQERTFKLVKANQELDRFVYSASHDLSAPLKSIQGLIGIAKMENKKNEFIRSLEYMEKSVLKLEDVINSLTQFSRNMGHEVTGRKFSFAEVIDEVLDELKYPYQADQITIVKNYSPDDTLESDYLRVKIILSNLISNALKYRKENSTDAYVEISFNKSGNTNIIRIKDNGIGIDKSIRDKVFSMFFRGTDQSKGSGLGLYIVNETLEKLQGKINLESVPRVYTLFTVTLPDIQRVTN